MADFDKFDRPSYSDEDALLAQPGIAEKIAPIKGAAEGILKKHGKKIIAAVIIVIVAYFAYDFFIGSYKTIEFSLTDTEGKALSASSFKVFDLAKNPVFETSGDSSFTAGLKPGEYKIEARSGSEYKSLNASIFVSEDTSEKIVFEKKIYAGISGFKENFPKALVAGAELSFKITVENNGSEQQEIEFVPSSELAKINLSVQPVIVSANSYEQTTVTISVPETLEIKNTLEGDALGGSLRIKYLNTKESVPSDVTLFPSPLIAISPTSITLSADAGKDVIKDFKIINNSTFPVYDINLSLEITSISKNSEEEILNSLELTQGKIIDSLGAKASKQNTFANKIRFNIPITAKEEIINANLVAQGLMLPNPIKWPITLKVADEINFGITITAPTSTTIKYDEDLGRYEKVQNKTISVRNTGTLDLSDIVVEVQNKTICTTEWLKIKQYEISYLPKGNSATLQIEISAPLSGNGTTVPCELSYFYTDPRDETKKVEGNVLNAIRITAEQK